MRALVTGGCGFIGRWVVAELLGRGHEVLVIDDLSNGSEENLAEFKGNAKLLNVVVGDVSDESKAAPLVEKADVVLHLAARINVQDSIDDPRDTFESDVAGTFELLEMARRRKVRFLYMSTCMVYARATTGAIREDHPTLPASPYAASKLAAEALTVSYAHAYGLAATVVRPFNTYGPFQKATGEGGVVSIFCARALAPEGRIQIYGDGTQTRDLVYASDCARFTVEAALSDRAVGEVLNAGTGKDVSVNDLAAMIQPDAARIEHVPHIHPQSEVMKLQADAAKAERLLGWKPEVPLEEGIERVKTWLASKDTA